MILVDTSIWIDFFNGNINLQTDSLDAALSEGIVAIGDLILLEVLQGFKTEKDFKRAKATLGTLEQYEMFNRQMALKCADNYRVLRRKGITVRGTADVIIATFCIEHQLPLLFSDRDFLPFTEHLGLTSALSEI
ncbi:MAG: PIN domain nuclease [Proteobacteria bacterium]|nr:PIN domain nuclease [Pseudomonadota bacterium]